MRNVILGAAAFLVLALGGLFASSAEAHGPRHSYYHGGGGWGHGHAPHCYYGGPPVRSYYRGPVVPYGGYYPSSGMYYRSPGFGLYLGF
jgi:hypothetical protein